MTTHTKRNLRAADMLALILLGFGLVLAGSAVLRMTGKAGSESGSPVGLWILAAVFVALGLALNLKVRQLIRNQGRESADYEGVPD